MRQLLAVFLLLITSMAWGADWYVNDTATTNDSWSILATGLDVITCGSTVTPCATIRYTLENRAATNDTIFVDAGYYYGTIPVTLAGVSIIGVDSATTFLVADTTPATTNENGFKFDGADNVSIRRMRIMQAGTCIRYNTSSSDNHYLAELFLSSNIDGILATGGTMPNARVSRCFFTHNLNADPFVASASTNITFESNAISCTSPGVQGATFTGGSDNALIYGNYFNTTGARGLNISGATSSVVVRNNIFDSCGALGGRAQARISGSGSFIVFSHNQFIGGGGALGDAGLEVIAAGGTPSFDTVEHCSFYNHTSDGLISSGTDIMLIGDTASGNGTGGGTAAGINISNLRNSVISCTSTSNSLYGLIVTGSEHLVDSNVFSRNPSRGIRNTGGVTNTRFRSNRIEQNGIYGIAFEGAGSSSENVFVGNVIRNNATAGVILSSSATIQLQTFAQNDFDSNGSNASVAYSATSASEQNKFFKNNFRRGLGTSGRFVNYTSTRQTLDMRRNYWDTTTENNISDSLTATFKDSVPFIPYRLGFVDTTLGSDTTAPDSPSAITLQTDGETVQINWTNPVADEEQNGGAFDFDGVRVYRRKTTSTDDWKAQFYASLSPATTVFIDSAVDTSFAYHYRLTAFGVASPENESWFTDTKTITIEGQQQQAAVVSDPVRERAKKAAASASSSLGGANSILDFFFGGN